MPKREPTPDDALDEPSRFIGRSGQLSNLKNPFHSGHFPSPMPLNVKKLRFTLSCAIFPKSLAQSNPSETGESEPSLLSGVDFSPLCREEARPLFPGDPFAEDSWCRAMEGLQRVWESNGRFHLKNISAMSKPSEWKQKGEQVLTRFISRTKKTVANMQNAGIEEMIGGKRTTPNKRGGSV